MVDGADGTNSRIDTGARTGDGDGYGIGAVDERCDRGNYEVFLSVGGSYDLACGLVGCGPKWYNRSVPCGGMIFLNSHVEGISWLASVDASHKILPTLYILQGKQATGDFRNDFKRVA